MTRTIIGTVHGRTIELTQELGLPDGQQVEVTVRPSLAPVGEPWGEGLRRCEGALANVPGLDDDIEEILGERNSSSFRDVHK